MKILSAHLFRFLALLILVCFLISCAGGGRYIKEPSPAPEIGISAANDDLHVTLNCLICPNAPGSWIKDAPWHEYMVTIKTPPDKPLTIYRMALVDPTGVERPSGGSPLQLIKASELLLKVYKDEGILEAAATGGMAASFLTSIPLIGPAVNIAAMHFQKGSHYADAKDQENIDAEFQRRKLQIPLYLSDNANVQGSIFFPQIPNPKALVMEYKLGRDIENKTLKFPLEGIQTK